MVPVLWYIYILILSNCEATRQLRGVLRWRREFNPTCNMVIDPQPQLVQSLASSVLWEMWLLPMLVTTLCWRFKPPSLRHRRNPQRDLCGEVWSLLTLLSRSATSLSLSLDTGCMAMRSQTTSWYHWRSPHGSLPWLTCSLWFMLSEAIRWTQCSSFFLTPTSAYIKERH